MTIDSVLTIIKDIIDICLVWTLIYFVLKSIKNNVKFTMLFKGIIIIVIILFIEHFPSKCFTEVKNDKMHKQIHKR